MVSDKEPMYAVLLVHREFKNGELDMLALIGLLEIPQRC